MHFLLSKSCSCCHLMEFIMYFISAIRVQNSAAPGPKNFHTTRDFGFLNLILSWRLIEFIYYFCKLMLYHKKCGKRGLSEWNIKKSVFRISPKLTPYWLISNRPYTYSIFTLAEFRMPTWWSNYTVDCLIMRLSYYVL